jgi:hypothetical protein
MNHFINEIKKRVKQEEEEEEVWHSSNQHKGQTIQFWYHNQRETNTRYKILMEILNNDVN